MSFPREIVMLIPHGNSSKWRIQMIWIPTTNVPIRNDYNKKYELC